MKPKTKPKPVRSNWPRCYLCEDPAESSKTELCHRCYQRIRYWLKKKNPSKHLIAYAKKLEERQRTVESMLGPKSDARKTGSS